MDSYYENNLNGEECEDPHCHGCQKPIEDGSVVQFGDGIWHFECFRCAKCQKLVECYSNLLLLRDGSPICEDCSYSCHACSKTIKDEAIMTGDEAYHADCFRCVQCSKKIDDLVFTQTSKGIYCTKCHEARKLLRLKRRDERNNNKANETSKIAPPTSLSNNPTRPGHAFRSSSTTSIVNAYIDEHLRTPILESNDISELNEMLMGQRSSEETLRNSIDQSHQLEQNSDDTAQVRELKRDLSETKNRLKEVESKFNKIKTISRKALDEFHMVKDGYASEVQARRDAENAMIRLKSELVFYQQASIFSGHDFIHYSKNEIEELNQTRADLEQLCHDLRTERDSLVNELENHSKNIEKLFASQKPQDLHWERLQHAYQQQLDSMQKDMSNAKNNYAKLIKGREDIISDMILLNTKNAELTQLNNDLSRRVMEREQEAKAVFAGMSFLTTPAEESNNSSSSTSTNTSSTMKHRRNLSTGSIGITHSTSMTEINNGKTESFISPATAKLAQRDSFNGSAAPKLFKFRRNKSGSGKHKMTNRQNDDLISVPYDSNSNSNTRSLEPVSESLMKKEPENVKAGKHHFAQQKFLRPIKCEACSEKMWRVNELKCSECGIVCHSKCIYSVPQACYRKSSLDSSRSDADSTRHMFGNDLIKQVQAEKSKVPLVVEKCIESVESRGMDYEGIYRKSGGVGQMRQIQQSFEKGEIPNLIDEEKWNDICAITSVLKQYFRELPNPLFTYELHSKFMDAMMIANSPEQLQTMTQLIQTLPIENFNTLKYLMEHLSRVQKRSKENLMTSKNLAVIFGPTLLRDPDENRDLLEMNHKINAIEFILNHMDTLFVIETIMGSATNTITSLSSAAPNNTASDHRRIHLPPLQRGEDLSTLLGNYQSRHDESATAQSCSSTNANKTALAAVPPRPNAGYI
ncbi:signal transducer [Mucor ambiguus]|uniref:Signal transducer n=1 Tax=Mucor ambiguus TaxID=91626 RepID=A0A0C9LV25_9FUNG|nr:signal transducer [Mucor ambiguus]